MIGNSSPEQGKLSIFRDGVNIFGRLMADSLAKIGGFWQFSPGSGL